MILRPGEKTVTKRNAKCVEGIAQETTGGISRAYQDYTVKVKGILYLTNQRLLFEFKEGFVFKKKGTSLDLPLSQIYGVHVENRFLSRKLVVETKDIDGSIRRNGFEMDNPNEFDSAIGKTLKDIKTR